MEVSWKEKDHPYDGHGNLNGEERSGEEKTFKKNVVGRKGPPYDGHGN